MTSASSAAAPASATPHALAPGLSRKLRKVLETRTDSSETLAALEALGELFPDNTAAARRGLRATVESQGLAINEAFVAAAEPVQARRVGGSATCEGARRGTSAPRCASSLDGPSLYRARMPHAK